MTFCEHTSLVQATSGGDLRLLEHGRFGRVIHQLRDPTNQFPSLQLFIGRKAKCSALRQLFPRNNFRRAKRCRNSVVDLALDISSSECDYPILIGESDPTCSYDATNSPEEDYCHITNCHPVRWDPEAKTRFYDVLHARLLFLFTDVICVFADDFQTEAAVIDKLRAWASYGSAAENIPSLLPQVLIVSTGKPDNVGFDRMRSAYLDLEDCEGHSRVLRSMYSGVKRICLYGQSLSPCARFQRLKEALMRLSDDMRQMRVQEGYLLSAVHTSKLYNKAFQHTQCTITRPFSFIRASRQQMEVPGDYQLHLTRFLKLCAQNRIPSESLAPYIASSILLNAYPPSMHRKFEALKRGRISLIA